MKDVNLNYTQNGTPVLHGGSGGALPVSAIVAFSPDGKESLQVFKLNDGLLSKSVSSTAAWTQASSYVASNQKVRSWTTDLIHQTFAGKGGVFSETTKKELTNTFTQSFSESLHKNKDVLEEHGIMLYNTGEWRTGGGGGGGIIIGKLFGKGGSSGRDGKGSADAGLNISLDTHTGKVKVVRASDGSEVKMDISNRAEEAIKTAYQEALSKAAQRVLSTESGYRDLYNLSQRESGDIRRAFEEASRIEKSFQERDSAELTGAVINEYAKRVYGGMSVSDIERTVQDLREAVAKGPEAVHEFLRKAGVSNGFDIKTDVEDKILYGEKNIAEENEKLQKLIDRFLPLTPPSGSPDKVPKLEIPSLKAPDFTTTQRKLEQNERFFDWQQKQQESIKDSVWSVSTYEQLKEKYPDLWMVTRLWPSINKKEEIFQSALKPFSHKEDKEKKVNRPILRP